MKELSREEKILIISDELMAFDDTLINAEAVKRATRIEYAINSSVIQTGMIGKFYSSWDSAMYGKLYEITNKNRYIARGGYGTTWDHFVPMTPDEIKKELEEMQR